MPEELLTSTENTEGIHEGTKTESMGTETTEASMIQANRESKITVQPGKGFQKTRHCKDLVKDKETLRGNIYGESFGRVVHILKLRKRLSTSSTSTAPHHTRETTLGNCSDA